MVDLRRFASLHPPPPPRLLLLLKRSAEWTEGEVGEEGEGAEPTMQRELTGVRSSVSQQQRKREHDRACLPIP